MEYNDECRHFVQFMLRNGCVTEEDAISFLFKVNPDEDRLLSGLRQIVNVINKEIVKDGFKIINSNCEITDKSYIMWVNLKEDKLSQMQTAYTSIQLVYFLKILTDILESEEKRQPYNVCILISNTLPNTIPKSEAYDLLDGWIKTGYFVKDGAFLYLGVRSIVEHASYLRDKFEEYLNTCSLCSENVYFGRKCEECENLFHKTCLGKYLRKKRNCPSCKERWKESNDENMED